MVVIFDVELGNLFFLGEFIKMWDDFNIFVVSGKFGDFWDKNNMKVKLVYGVLREWCCFKFYELIVEDIV